MSKWVKTGETEEVKIQQEEVKEEPAPMLTVWFKDAEGDEVGDEIVIDGRATRRNLN